MFNLVNIGKFDELVSTKNAFDKVKYGLFKSTGM